MIPFDNIFINVEDMLLYFTFPQSEYKYMADLKLSVVNKLEKNFRMKGLPYKI